MKHSKIIAALATAGSVFAMSSAHAIVPAAAAAIGALAGAAVGSAAAQANNPPAVAVVPAPSVAVVPSDPTLVMGGPPTVVEEVIPAPHDGYHWERGHYETHAGMSEFVPGHLVSNDVVIYEN